MSIYEDVQANLTIARKARNKNDVNTYILIKGELDRVMTMQDGRKIVWDTEALKVITKMYKGAVESLGNGATVDAEYLEVLKSFMPEEVDPLFIRDWIDEHINLEDYKNKMQAMKPIMVGLKEYGAVGVDGNVVKNILMEM